MAWQDILEVGANFASIATAAVAVAVAAYYWCDREGKRKKLEAYLKAAKANRGEGKIGQKSIMHLMAQLRMTEAEIFNASFRSKHIENRVKADENRMATAILLEYVGPLE